MVLVHLHTQCPKTNEQATHFLAVPETLALHSPCGTFDKARGMLLNGNLISKNVWGKIFRILETQKSIANSNIGIQLKEQTALANGVLS